MQRGASAPSRWRQFYAGIYAVGAAVSRYRTFWPFVGSARTNAPPVNQASSYAGPLVDAEAILALDAAWSCVWRYANTISTLPLPLMRVGKFNTGTPARDHDLYQLLTVSPSPGVTAAAFWQAIVLSMQLWGNGYARILRVTKGGPIVGLKLMRPEHVTPFLTDQGELRYQYAPGPGMDALELTREDVFHVFDRSADGLVGMSRIQYGRNLLGLALSGEQASGLAYRNGLRASGFVKIQQWLNKEKRDAYRTEVERFTGAPGEGYAGRQGGVMILENGMDFTPINMKPVDVEVLASRRFSVEQVCRFWDVPPVLVHHAADGQTMWGTGVSAIILGWQKTGLTPVLTMIEQAINLQLLTPVERKTLYAQFRLDALLRGDPVARWQQHGVALDKGAMCRDEVRAIEDMAPLPDGIGQIYTVQSAMVDLSKLGDNPAPEAEQLRNALTAFLRVNAEPKPTESTP